MTGTIKRLVRDRGFGFIRDEQGTEYFFHRSAMASGRKNFDQLQEGDRVEFDEDDAAQGKGPRAANVKAA